MYEVHWYFPAGIFWSEKYLKNYHSFAVDKCVSTSVQLIWLSKVKQWDIHQIYSYITDSTFDLIAEEKNIDLWILKKIKYTKRKKSCWCCYINYNLAFSVNPNQDGIMHMQSMLQNWMNLIMFAVLVPALTVKEVSSLCQDFFFFFMNCQMKACFLKKKYLSYPFVPAPCF